MKKLIFAALLVASLSAKAQTESKPYIGIKYPVCDTSSLIVWKYERSGVIETLTNPDLRGQIQIDWGKNLVSIGNETYKIKSYETSAIVPKVSLEFGEGIKLVIVYDQKSAYKGHKYE